MHVGAPIFLGIIVALGRARQRVDVHLGPTRRSSSPTRPACSRAGAGSRGGRRRSSGVPAEPAEHMFSISMLWFMVGTAHFYNGAEFGSDLSGGKVAAFLVVSLLIVAVLEADPARLPRGTGPGPLRWPYESVRNVLISGSVLSAVLWILSAPAEQGATGLQV